MIITCWFLKHSQRKDTSGELTISSIIATFYLTQILQINSIVTDAKIVVLRNACGVKPFDEIATDMTLQTCEILPSSAIRLHNALLGDVEERGASGVVPLRNLPA